MNTIWGSAPNDVWIASSGGAEKLWHFDGNEWSPYSPRFVGDFYSIFGFAQDDVWMGGGNGELWHFDGQEWGLFYTYRPEGLGGPNIFDIWGNSPSNIYAVGTVPPGQEGPYKGFILHYDGNQWKELLLTEFGAQFQGIREGDQGVFIKGVEPAYGGGAPGTLVLYRYKNGELQEELSILRDGTANRIWTNIIGKDMYILNGKDLQKYSGRTLVQIDELSDVEIVFSFFARHEKDIFLSTSDGVLHYNGKDIQLLFNDIVQPRAVLFENDVFFFANDYDAGTNLIYHGTLTKEEGE